MVASAKCCPADGSYWRSALIIGTLLLLGGNGGVCWAEQYVPSSFAALLVATVPLWMILLNAFRPGGVRPNGAEIAGVAGGFLGLAILVDPFSMTGAGAVNLYGAGVLVLAALFWSVGSLYSRSAPRPSSPILSTGMEMLAGGLVLVCVGAITGEWSAIHPETISLTSCLALAYLIVFGALIGYTAYMWLLRVSTPARVSTYAYVNPVVAVTLGWLVASEPITARMLIAMVVIVASVVLITTHGRAAKSETVDSAAHKNKTEPGILSKSTPVMSGADVEAAKEVVSVPVESPFAKSLTLARLQGELKRSERSYLEFHRNDSMSVGLYVLPEGGFDPQIPHTEDEMYFIVAGRAKLMIDGRDYVAEPGSIHFVKAGIEHRFHEIEEDLSALVFFAPAEYSREEPTITNTRETCTC